MLQLFIADNDIQIADSIQALTDAGRVQVTHFSAGDKLFSVAHTEQPALILLSTEVPKGLFWCGKLRKSSQVGHVPLVMLYEPVHESTIQQHQRLAVRATAYVPKPVDPDGVYDLLKRYVPDTLTGDDTSTSEETIADSTSQLSNPTQIETDVLETVFDDEYVEPSDPSEVVEIASLAAVEDQESAGDEAVAEAHPYNGTELHLVTREQEPEV